jgi:hypothetical protein
MLYFLVLSSFFLGGVVRQWLLEHPLDVWDKIALIVHPVVILVILINKG